MNIHEALKANIPLKGHYKFTLTDINTGETEVFEYENVITAAYWEVIANNAVDPTPTSSILLSTAVLGTGSNTPSTSDTSLQTQVYTNNLASKSNVTNVAYATAYFNATETSGTYREAGIKTADLVLASRVAINITKTTSQTMTMDWALTIGT